MIARSAFTGLAVFLASGSALHAASPQPIGSAVQIVNLVYAEYNRDTRSLQEGDRVHQDETIEVGIDASSEFKLDDDTKLALGPGSHLKLDKFVYDPDKSNGSIIVDLLKGTFRFMTGVAEKPTYVIKTPAAAITVRGTIFDVFVQSNVTWVLLHEGAVQIRGTSGVCKDLYEPGKLIRIDNTGAVGPPVRWASLAGNDSVPFNDAFPFVAKKPSIDPDPVLTRDVIMTGALPSGARPSGGNCDDDDGKPDVTPRNDTDSTPQKVPKYKKPKQRDVEYDPPKYEKKKKRRADKYDDGDSKIVKGLGVGIGIGIGLGMGKHKPGGYPGGHRPGSGMGGGMGGYGGSGRGR
jgi:hypothetical protein